jgi:excisionase family DNA binding protein
MKLLTTKEAAQVLGLSAIRVRELIRSGKIEAQQVGRDWVIQESALQSVIVYGKAGRPSKPKSEEAEPKVSKKTSSTKKPK